MLQELAICSIRSCAFLQEEVKLENTCCPASGAEEDPFKIQAEDGNVWCETGDSKYPLTSELGKNN